MAKNECIFQCGNIVRTIKPSKVGKVYSITENPRIKKYIITVIFYKYEINQYRKEVFVSKAFDFFESELIKANLNEIFSYNMSYTKYLLENDIKFF